MTKAELNEIILEEKNLYLKSNLQYYESIQHKRYIIWKYLLFYRKTQYFRSEIKCSKGIRKGLLEIILRYYTRKKNVFSWKSGVEIANDRHIGRRLDIWHGGIVINCDIGDDCVLRGNTIIGNRGLKNYDGEPVIGNNVEIGAGAVVIGNIKIADNCQIGANAVVTRSFNEPGSIIVGIPGRVLKKG